MSACAKRSQTPAARRGVFRFAGLKRNTWFGFVSPKQSFSHRQRDMPIQCRTGFGCFTPVGRIFGCEKQFFFCEHESSFQGIARVSGGGFALWRGASLRACSACRRNRRPRGAGASMKTRWLSRAASDGSQSSIRASSRPVRRPGVSPCGCFRERDDCPIYKRALSSSAGRARRRSSGSTCFAP